MFLLIWKKKTELFEDLKLDTHIWENIYELDELSIQ